MKLSLVRRNSLQSVLSALFATEHSIKISLCIDSSRGYPYGFILKLARKTKSVFSNTECQSMHNILTVSWDYITANCHVRTNSVMTGVSHRQCRAIEIVEKKIPYSMNYRHED